MKILIVCDVKGWAIDKLATAKVKYNPHHIFKVEYVHPKDVTQEVADRFLETVKEFNPDIIHYEYYRTGGQLIQFRPELRAYKSIVTHHNQRDKALYAFDWNELGIDMLVTHTQKAKKLLQDRGFKKVSVIQHGIDLDYFTYSDEEPKDNIIGYVGRVVAWKGLKEISEVAAELGYTVMAMGKIDDPAYYETCNKDVVQFGFFNVPDEERINAYRSMKIFVCNSKDGYEEGTLPLLEAMASGVPVVSTPAGVANDIGNDGENMLMCPFEDKEVLKLKIKQLMEDADLRKKLRKEGWNTVKNMPEQKMAYEYSKLYHKVAHPDEKLISVVISTYNRKAQIETTLIGLTKQTYKSFEVIVADDDSDDGTEELVMDLRAKVNYTLKYINTKRDGYNLALARNMAAVEADGDYLVFLDSRLLPDMEALSVFAQSLAVAELSNNKIWYFGDKGTGKRAFVENFSAVLRSDFMLFGMMNEQIDRYGGMSQDTRIRWTAYGGSFQFLGEAKAGQILGSKWNLERRADTWRMKLKLHKMYGNVRL